MARLRRSTFDTRHLPGLFDDLIKENEATDGTHTSASAPSKTGATQSARASRSRSTYRHDHSGRSEMESSADHNLEPLSPTGNSCMRFISFGSGSSGNCSYLGNDRFGLLIDAGVEPEHVLKELNRCSISASTIGGIILTHDHGDHVRFAYTILRKFRHMRLYCTPKTLNGLLRRHSISRRIKDYHQPIFKEFPFHLADFVITPFEVNHDGTDNVGFYIAAPGQSFVVATDMGSITDRANFYMRRANHLMIEANYDLKMLLEGSYPEYLKARIMSGNGHMDNEATAAYLKSIYSPELRSIFLCHLSHDNNTPTTAITTITTSLRDSGVTVGDGSGSIVARQASVQLMALPRFDSTGLIILR